MAEDSTHHHINISLYMVIPAHLSARWWALGGWGKRLCVEGTGGCGGARGGGWGREDSDWRVRGRMGEEVGNEYTEISDRSMGGGMIELTMSDRITFTVAVLKTDSAHPVSDLHWDNTPLCYVDCRLPGRVSHHIFIRPQVHRCQ